jgi:hypothetical protein
LSSPSQRFADGLCRADNRRPDTGSPSSRGFGWSGASVLDNQRELARTLPSTKSDSSAMTDLLLERVFQRTDGRPLKVNVGIPEKTTDMTDEWSCSYQIDGMGDAKVRKAYGVDGIQAFILALTYISTTLYTSLDYRKGQIFWDGGTSGDLGLPTAAAVRDMLREQHS